MTKHRSKRKRTSLSTTRRYFKRKKCSNNRRVIKRNLESHENSSNKEENASISTSQISITKVFLLLINGIFYFLWLPKFIYEGILSILQLYFHTKNIPARELEEVKERLKALEDKIEEICFQQCSSQNVSSSVKVTAGHCSKCSVVPTVSGTNVTAPPPPPPPPPLPLAPIASHIAAAISSSTRKGKLDLSNKKPIQKTPALHSITLEDLKSVKLRKTKRKLLPDSPDTKKNSPSNEENLKSTLLRIRGLQCYGNSTANKENFSINTLSLSSAKNLNFRRVLRSTNQLKSPGGTPLLKNIRPKQTLRTPPAFKAARKLLTEETPGGKN